MENKEFREKFDKEYQNLCIGEKIAEIRHRKNLTKGVPVTRRKNNKSFLILTIYTYFYVPCPSITINI